MNAVARFTIKTTRPLMLDNYRDDRIPGSFILIDDSTYETLAAGKII